MADFRSRRDAYIAFTLGISLLIVGFCALLLLMLQHIARRLAEMRLRAESASRLNSDLLCSISHELRFASVEAGKVPLSYAT